jgi:hypothetical protein
MSTAGCAGVVLTAALALVVGGGCGGPGTGVLKTYPAKGKVVLTDGQPLTAGMVEFRSTADASLTTTGEIRPDGTFSLNTLVGTKKVPGRRGGRAPGDGPAAPGPGPGRPAGHPAEALHGPAGRRQ